MLRLGNIFGRQLDSNSDKIDIAKIPRRLTNRRSPINQGGLVGWCALGARMLGASADFQCVAGAMLTFDDFVIFMERSGGMEKFGQRIPPETTGRAEALPA